MALAQPKRSRQKRPGSWLAWLAGGAGAALVLALLAQAPFRSVPDNIGDPKASVGSSSAGAIVGAGPHVPDSDGAAERPEDIVDRPMGDASSGSAGAGIDFDAPCGARVPGAIPADSAGDFLDSFQALEFEVLRGKDTGKVTFLNSHDPYQGHFYVAIFPGDYERFGGDPAQRFKGRCIVVQGLIETYRGSPQIVLRDAADLRVVERDALE